MIDCGLIYFLNSPVEQQIIHPSSQQLMHPDFLVSQSTLVHELDVNSTSKKKINTEIQKLKKRVNSVESHVADLEEQKFSPTLTLSGEAVFGITNVFGKDINESAVFQGSVELTFNASFTGEDELEVSIETGNLVESSFIESTTFEGRLGFLSDSDRNRIELSELSYEFPIGERLSVYISTTGDDLSDFNPFFDSKDNSGDGPISEFGSENPIHNLVEDFGLQLNYDLTENLSISLGYFAEEANSSESGLFNGNQSSFVQLEFEPSDKLLLGFTYIHSYNDSSLSTDTGSLRSQLDLERPVIGHSYGIGAFWAPSSLFAIGGWVGLTKANVIDVGNADIWNYALTLNFPDFGKEGNILGFVIGQEPKLTRTSGFTIDDRKRDPDTSLHIEAFYINKLNDNLSVTPGIIWITAPNHNRNNADIVLFTVRTTFKF